GEPWPAPGKPFFFRAPATAVETLVDLGVDAVTLANNHALDFGEVALLDTMDLLDEGGIAHVGAGRDVDAARSPVLLTAKGFRLRVIGVTDHPEDFAASGRRAGVALDALAGAPPPWLADAIAAPGADAVLVTPHWGPNMTPEPIPRVRAAAEALVDAGATVVAGHSAHVFHGVGGRVLFDLGDFLDDYAVDPDLRNDLGLLWLVTVDETGPGRIEAIPLGLDFCFTRLADPEEAAWIGRRFREACSAFATQVAEEDGRLAVSPR
ncbi:MAG TPA: CapA family protein, partial [Actinomycetota bacterium]